MKVSKWFKIALPILGIGAIATILPLSLTACNGSSNTNTPNEQVVVLEPLNVNDLIDPTHNFANSLHQKATEISSLADANNQLISTYQKMTDEEKTNLFTNDLKALSNLYNKYVYGKYPNYSLKYSHWLKESMVDFAPVTTEAYQQIFAPLGLAGDKTAPKSMPSTYQYRVFTNFNVSDVQFHNNQLSFTFTQDTIYQIKDGSNIIAQMDNCTTTNYSNLTVQPFAWPLYGNNLTVIGYYSSFMMTQGTSSSTQVIKNIMSNNTTPFTDYFKANVNKTYLPSDYVPGVSSFNGFGIYRPSSTSFNFTDLYNQCLKATDKYTMRNPDGSTSAEVILDSMNYSFVGFAKGNYNPLMVTVDGKQTVKYWLSPVGFMSPTLNQVYLVKSNTTNSSDNSHPSQSDSSKPSR